MYKPGKRLDVPVTTDIAHVQHPLRLGGFLRRVMDRSGVPGIAVTVVSRGTVTSTCVGEASIQPNVPMTPETEFHIGCVFHLLTDIAVLKLATSAVIDVDAPIETYLPELSPDRSRPPIRVKHLLSHTSGVQPPGRLPYDGSGHGEWEAFRGFFKSAPLLFSPGSVFNYHVHGHLILRRLLTELDVCTPADILTGVVGCPCSTLLERVLERPRDLRLRAESHQWDGRAKNFHLPIDIEIGCANPAGESAITMTTVELAQLARLLMDARTRKQITGDSWLSEAAILLTESIVKIPQAEQLVWQRRVPNQYGLGCAQYEGEYYGYTGSSAGQCCGLYFDPALDLAVGIAINACARRIRDGVITTIFKVAREAHYGKSFSTPEPCNSYTPHVDYAGVYICAKDDVEIQVDRVDGGWSLTMTDTDAGRLHIGTVTLNGSPIIKSNSMAAGSRLPVCFFHEPEHYTPCLMLGVCAFRKK